MSDLQVVLRYQSDISSGIPEQWAKYPSAVDEHHDTVPQEEE